jgi:hypothetical protein
MNRRNFLKGAIALVAAAAAVVPRPLKAAAVQRADRFACWVHRKMGLDHTCPICAFKKAALETGFWEVEAEGEKDIVFKSKPGSNLRLLIPYGDGDGSD